MKFVLYKDRTGQWRWSLKTAQDKTVADSTEGYASREEAEAAINVVRQCGEAPVTLMGLFGKPG